MNLLLLEPPDIDDTHRVRLSGPRARHLIDVLRVVPDQTVRLGMLDGPFGVGTVRSVGAGEVELDCRFDDETPDRPRVDLLLAVPRPKVLRRLWAQLAALGVGRIILTNAEKVERNYFDAHALTEAHHRPLLIEGLQQARDTRLPLVSVHRRLKVLVEDDLDALAGQNLRVVADPSATMTIAEMPVEHRETRVLLAVGPEGGWNSYELSMLAAHGFLAVGMGGRTLRTDTACVALLTLCHERLSRPGAAATGAP